MKNDIIVFISENRKFLLWCAIVLVVIMAIPPYSSFFMYITGDKAKLEFLKFFGWGISGLIAIFGVIGIFERAKALDNQNIINKKGHVQQAEAWNKQHEMIEKGHVQERFKAATEHLGNKSISVRIAAFNEFCHLAEIEQVWRKPIFDILCAHLRQTAKDENHPKKEKELDTEEPILIKPTEEPILIKPTEEPILIKPTEEVKNLLNILFKLDDKNKFIFVGMVADLKEINLQGADLQKALMQKAILKWADLQEADLQHAVLKQADLQHAKLQYTKLQGANLQGANLQGANLKDTILCDTDLQDANLQYANLQLANLQGANLQGVNLQDAILQYANLQGARINQYTRMPDHWKNIVKIDKKGKTGVLVVNDQGKIIECL